SFPSLYSSIQRLATLKIRSLLATELPPNFLTINIIPPAVSVRSAGILPSIPVRSRRRSFHNIRFLPVLPWCCHTKDKAPALRCASAPLWVWDDPVKAAAGNPLRHLLVP